jgi:hypothetical protein
LPLRLRALAGKKVARRFHLFYQQHSTELGALPADPAERQSAWEKIDQAIRQRLAPQLQAEHQAGVQQFIGQLKAAARIDIPSS